MDGLKIRFGDVRFDSNTRQVFRGGAEVHLSGKALQLLKFLVEQRPRAVSKQDLQAHLWPETFVTEANLPSLIKEIREAIGDDARNPKYVATLHGFGYAFRAVVAAESSDTAADCRLIGAGIEIRLGYGENIIGRDGLAGATLDSHTVSRQHARIVIGARAILIEDLGSKNGTFVNSRPVTAPCPLADGDQVRIGSFLMTFKDALSGVSTMTQSVEP
jgi:DNA-binding winged helix-turn-helix (wHTH) protein